MGLKLVCKECILKLMDDPKNIKFYWMKSLYHRKCDLCGKENLTVDFITEKEFDRIEEKNDKKNYNKKKK